MATPAAVLNILVRANTASANLGLAKVNAQARMTAGRFGDLDKSTNKTSHNMRNFARVGAGAAVGGLVAFGVVAKKSVTAAVDLGEEINKTKVVFRGSEQSILNWSKTTASALGISRREALQSAGTFGNMLVPMGFARKEAGQMSVRMVKLAADMASFNNASPKETLDALRSGLAGETEPLRRYGVFLNDARLKQEAMNMGLKNAVGPNGALTTNAKALATYSLILKDSKDAQGDFHRTSGSLANQQRVLRAQFEDVSAKLGTALIPALVAAMKWLTKFIHQMETGKGAGGKFAAIMNELVVSFKHFFEWVGNAIHNIDRFGKGGNRVFFAMLRWFSEVFNEMKRIFGNVMAAIFRGFAKLFDVASHLPGIGGKFGDLRDKANRFADSVDKAGEKTNDLRGEIRKLHGKELDIKVNLLLNDPATKPLVPLPRGGPGLQDRIEDISTKRGRKWALDHLDEIAPLLGAPGNAPGRLGLLEALGHRMGLYTSSGYRPGDPGFHGQNRARDLAGPAGTMLQYARMLYTRFGTTINELIHTPLGVGINDHIAGPLRSLYPASTLADHYDHVHVAMQQGGLVQGLYRGGEVAHYNKWRGLRGLPAVGWSHRRLMRYLDNHPQTALRFWRWYGDHLDKFHSGTPIETHPAQRGGGVPGSGSGDKVPALLEPGEFVMNRNATRAAGPMLAALNKGIPRFQKGGGVPLEYRRLIAMGQNRYGIPGNILAGLIDVESGWNPNAVSPAGAFGLTQFMPATARSYGVARGSGHHAVATQILGAAHYLKDLGFARNKLFALGAYNGGPGNPQYGYANAVIAAAAKYAGDLALENYGNRGRNTGKARRHGRVHHRERNADENLVPRPTGNAARMASFLSGTAEFAQNKFGAGAALAGLTADKADDIANAQAALDFYKAYLPLAVQSGDPQSIQAIAGGITEWSDQLESLTAVEEEQNDLLQQQIAATEAHTAAVNELKDQQKRNEDLIRAQGPSLRAALIQTVNGGLGGNAGLGRQFPSSTGLGGLSRA